MKKVEGIWVLAMTGDTRGYVAKLPGQALDATWLEDIRVKKAPLIAIEAYDYFSPIRPVQVPGPQGQHMTAMSREPLVTGFEFTMHPVETAIDWKTLTFIDAMHQADQETYEGFILAARQQNLEMRLRKSNLVPPQQDVPSVMPDGNGGFKIDLRDLTRR